MDCTMAASEVSSPFLSRLHLIMIITYRFRLYMPGPSGLMGLLYFEKQENKIL